MDIDWDSVKIVVGKAAFAGFYAGLGYLVFTKTADWNALVVAGGAAALRGLAVFMQELHNAWKPTLESRLGKVRLRDLL